MKTDPETEETLPTEEPAAETETAPEVNLAEEVAKYRDMALRAHAELDNYRKRVAREKEESIRYANSNLLESLLPVLDNFQLGLDAAKTATDTKGILFGMEMVRKQMEDFLKDHGVEVLDATGQEFDPNLHDAVGHEASDEVEENKVLRQVRRGFKLKDRLIRPATVIVSKGRE